jgi:TRAP transporter TAXI family solute receptor
MIVVLILLPVGIWWFSQDVIEPVYRKLTHYPSKITIAAGSEGGRYHVISEKLAEEIKAKLDVEVVLLPTEGSLGNILCLEANTAHFALYQPGTLEVLKRHHPDVVKEAEIQAGIGLPEQGSENVAFVANLYMQPAHFIVRTDADIKKPVDLKNRPVSVGWQQSGDYAMSLLLLDHFGLDKGSIDTKHLSYADVEKGFANGSLDAAFNTVGRPAPVFELFKTEKCDLLEIPHATALARKHVFISEYTIPAGLYLSQPLAKPSEDIETVAIPAQLLTRKDLNSDFIRDVTGLVLGKHFASQNNLHELLEGGKVFAQANPEFFTHPGAQSFYDPELDIHLIETGEAALSLAVSTLIAVFFSVRWLSQHRAKKKGHKLDVYIQKLLEIEKRQIGLDKATRRTTYLSCRSCSMR